MASKISTLLALVALVSAHLAVVQCQNESAIQEILLGDTSNDDAIRLSTQELITRSGFQYKNYYAVADDGFITEIIRVINPKATQLRKPPMAMMHGANIDPSCYFISSSIQHFPEPWPRNASDGPYRSSNRSLGFYLANEGYDVYLIGSRGCNKANQRHTNDTALQQRIRNGDYSEINDPKLFEYAKTSEYWNFYGQDDVVNYEIKHQLDLIRNITNQTELFLFSYSLSTTTSSAFLSLNPDYAKNVKVYFQMGPAIAATHNTPFDALYFEKISPFTPTRGIGFVPSFTLQSILREFLIAASVNVEFKYTFVHALYSQIFGPSPLFTTFIERNVISHTLQPVSYKTVQQYSQNSVERSFDRFDYGSEGNERYYGQSTPPPYNIGNLSVQQYCIVSGSNDSLADVDTVNRLLATVHSSPFHVFAEFFNHVDLIAGYYVDKLINEPIKQILDQFNN